MAVPAIDIGLLGHFAPIFSFLFVFIIVYAVLHHTRVLGENKIVQSALGLVVGLIFALYTDLTKLLFIMAPWFTVLFIFIIFLIAAYKIFGATDDNIRSVIQHHSGIQWTLAILAIIIIVGSLSAVFSQKQLEIGTGVEAEKGAEGALLPGAEYGGAPTTTSSFAQNLAATLYHPKTLGIAFILIIAALSIALLTRRMAPDWP